MSPSPSRRRVLAACGAALGSALTGCLGRNADPATTTTSTTTSASTSTTATTSSTDEPTTTTDAGVGAHVSAASRYDEDVALTVEVRRGGERVERRTETVSAGVNQALGIEVSEPGEYAVLAGLERGAEAEYDWRIGDEYGGSLQVRIREDGSLGFREFLAGEPCGGADLPYAVSGNEATFTPSSADIRNDSGRAVTVTLSVAHDEETFFECAYDLGANQTVSLDGLTETAGEYAVTVDVADGGRTEYDWRIPPDHNWPQLLVVVPESGDPLAGCGGPGAVDVVVANSTEEPRTTDLTLLRDGESVAEERVSVEAGAETSVSLATPIGDFYTLRAETTAGSAETGVADCYCYAAFETVVTLGGDDPTVESTRMVCD